MRGLWQRLKRFGFAAFLLGVILFAIGVYNDISALWELGLVTISAIVLIIVGRSIRDTWWPQHPHPRNGAHNG
jgi:hypothetical protein